MTTRLIRPAAEVLVDGDAVPVDDGQVTLDESWAPYAQGQIQLPLEPTEGLAIDPRDGDRVTLTASLEGGTVRTFDLGVRSRQFDYSERTCTLQLGSDEALLQDYAPLADNTQAWSRQASLRSVVNYVLDLVIPGAALAATPSVDADVTAYWQATNLMPNPAVRAVLGNWTPGGVNGSMIRESGYAPGAAVPTDPSVITGTLTTWSGASGLGQGGAVANTAAVVPYAPVQPFRTYTVSVHVFSNTAKPVQLACQVFGSDGAVLSGGTVLLPSVAVPANVWTRITGTITTPANASRLGPFIYAAAGNQWTAGATFRTTGWMIYEGSWPTPLPYFDGATPAGGGYTYGASGAPHASAAVRTPLVERDPDLLIWHAGVSAWDFLQPLITQAQLRLFCDETRTWRLVPEEYDTDGSVILNGAVATEANDTISRLDASLWAQGVVVRYAWTDANGVSLERVDAAGTPGKVLVITYDRPYPGPGAAAGILSRMNARGRVQDVVALADYTASPGEESRTELPGGGLIVGRVRSIQWDLTPGLMTVQSRQQTEIPPDSWAAVEPPTTRWMDVPNGVTWATYTP